MEKIIYCFIYDEMTDFEITLACHLLDEYKVKTIAFEKKKIKAMSGMTYIADETVEEAIQNLENVSGIIIPGGINLELRNELIILLRKLNEDNKMIAAICAGTQYLARCGILDDRMYTTTIDSEILNTYFPELGDDPFPRQNFIPQNVVQDKNIITAVGNAFVDFAAEINEYLYGKESSKEYISNHYKGENYFS